MDYTQVPRALIYKDRDDLDNFPVIERFDPPQMEARFLDALEQRPFIKKSYADATRHCFSALVNEGHKVLVRKSSIENSTPFVLCCCCSMTQLIG